jgi:hypothetical protein
MSPSDAIPTTTVRKITGAVIVFTSWRKASASHFASFAASGAASPNAAPAPIPMTTQNHNCAATRRRRPDGTACIPAPLRDSSPAASPRRDHSESNVRMPRPRFTLAVASVDSVV